MGWSRNLRGLIRYVLGLLAVIGAYPLAAVVLGVLPVNRNYAPPADGIEIFLVTNGIHSSLALPLVSSGIDWRPELATPSWSVGAETGFVLVGWGDRTIYTQVGSWANLRVSHAVTAMLGINPSVLRAEHIRRPTLGPSVVSVTVSREGYVRLAEYVRKTLERGADGRAFPIADAARHSADAFYVARGNYSMFRTCNEWVRAALAEAGVRTAWWSPFDLALFHHLRR